MIGILQSISENLPYYLLALPVLLLSLSVHEMCHAFTAYKLGDDTAYNFGRVTLNPIKHLDPVGFICMALFHFGWAKPVPVNSRNFKNPRRGMAITALAGPVSNLLLSVIFLLLLRLSLLAVGQIYGNEIFTSIAANIWFDAEIEIPAAVKALAILSYILYIGVSVNISLAIFNLIPINPLDGSRILHIFLPIKWYYWLVRYERYIYIGLLVIVGLGLLSGPLSFLTTAVMNGFFAITGMPEDALNILLGYVSYGLGG